MVLPKHSHSDNEMDSSSDSLKIEVNDEEVDVKPVIKKRKRKGTSDRSNEEDDILPENCVTIEEKLNTTAVKNNLTAANVKNILKRVVTNEHVLAIVKLQEEQSIVDEDDIPRPKITRAKAKELKKADPDVSWPLPLTPVKIPTINCKEVKALITKDLPEEDDDDEYQPSLDPNQESDDERDTLGSLSDIDSQPTTPATPSSQTGAETAGPSTKWTDDGLFKIPEDAPSCANEDKREATIALRTRSKLCLSDTSIETIEESFVHPDIRPDDIEDNPMDDVWRDFLAEFISDSPEKANTFLEEDDEADPEYNAANDKVKPDRDEFLEGAEAQVSKKELNDLVSELFDIDFFDIQDVLLAEPPSITPVASAAPAVPIKKEISDIGDPPIEIIDLHPPGYEEQPTKQEPTSKPEDPISEPSKNLNESSTNTAVSRDASLTVSAATTSIPPLVQISNQPNTINLVIKTDSKEQKKGKRKKEDEDDGLMEYADWILQDGDCQLSEVQKLILNQQIRQHVQIAAQAYLLLYSHPKLWTFAPQEKEFLVNFKNLAADKKDSFFNPINLDPALETCLAWEEKLATPSPENEGMMKFLNLEVERSVNNSRNKYYPKIPHLVMEHMAGSKAFIFPDLLPPMGFRFNYVCKKEYLPSEICLIALGIDQFYKYIRRNPKIYRPSNVTTDYMRVATLLNSLLMTCRPPGKLCRFIQSMKLANSPDNPIKELFRSNTIPATRHIIHSVKLKQLKDHKFSSLPFVWQKYLNPRKAKLMMSGQITRGVYAAIGSKLQISACKPKEKPPAPVEYSGLLIPITKIGKNTSNEPETEESKATTNTKQSNDAALSELPNHDSNDENSDFSDDDANKPLEIDYTSDKSDETNEAQDPLGEKQKSSENKHKQPAAPKTAGQLSDLKYINLNSSLGNGFIIINNLEPINKLQPTFTYKILTNPENNSSALPLNNTLPTQNLNNEFPVPNSNNLIPTQNVNVGIPIPNSNNTIPSQNLNEPHFPNSICESPQTAGYDYGVDRQQKLLELKSLKNISAKLYHLLIHCRRCKIRNLQSKFKSRLINKAKANLFSSLKQAEMMLPSMPYLSQLSKSNLEGSDDSNEVTDVRLNTDEKGKTANQDATAKKVPEEKPPGVVRGPNKTSNASTSAKLKLAQKTQRELESNRVMFAAQDMESSDLEDLRFATAYFEKVQSRLNANSSDDTADSPLFLRFQDLLDSYDPERESPCSLHRRLEVLLGPAHADLAEEFLAFLTPGQAASAGKFMEHFMLTSMSDFIEKLHLYFGRKPAALRKVLVCLEQLVQSAEGGKGAEGEGALTMEAVRAALLPHLRCSHYLTEWFLRLFPEERPPESQVSHGFEVLDVERLGKEEAEEGSPLAEGRYEVLEVPALRDPSGTPACLCHCHQGTDNHPPSAHAHCIACRIKYMQGRVYVQQGRQLRPGHISWGPEETSEAGGARTGAGGILRSTRPITRKRTASLDPAKTESDEERVSPKRSIRTIKNPNVKLKCVKSLQNQKNTTKTSESVETLVKSNRTTDNADQIPEEVDAGRQTKTHSMFHSEEISISKQNVTHGAENASSSRSIQMVKENAIEVPIVKTEHADEEMLEMEHENVEEGRASEGGDQDNIDCKDPNLKIAYSECKDQNVYENASETVGNNSLSNAEIKQERVDVETASSSGETSAMWTREEDKVILLILQSGNESGDIFGKINEVLPHRSREDIRERFASVMILLQQMANDK